MKQLTKNISKLLLPLLTVLTFSMTVNAAVPANKPVQIKRTPDQILVQFKPGVSAAAIANSHKPGSQPVSEHGYSHFDGLKMFKLPPGQSVEDAIAHYKKNPNVLFAEPDGIVELDSTNDTSYNQLWGLENTGQTINGTAGTNDVDMNIPEAWSNGGSTGSNSIVIGVIDTGVNYNHSDLAANMWINPNEIAGNGIDDDGNGYIDDVYGINAITGSGNPMDDNDHGSHVAGTIAAVGNNSNGITGINQQAKILACKFLSASGSGSDSDALKCLDYIYDLKMKGINIVVTNNSWGGTGGGSQAVAAAIEKHRQAGILFIAAAGNETNNNDTGPHYPSNYFKANVISVAATDQNDGIASFSNYGNRSVHVGAPGVNIYSTVSNGGYQYFQGTSMAAPHVTGLAALLFAQDPNRDWIAVKNLILAGGTPTGAMNGKTATGRRVRAWDSNGTGSMSCTNQTVSAVLYPQTTSSTKVAGTKLGLAALNINCDVPAGTVLVTTSGGAVADLTLQDNGLEFDEVAGDGIYSGYWTAPASAGSYTLTFSNGQTQTVNVITSSSSYQAYRQPVEITSSWIADPLSQAYSTIPYGATGYLAMSPFYFSVNFGGVNTSTFYALPNGVVMPGTAPSTANHYSYSNTPLANESFIAMIAGYWDDLDLSASGYGIKGWESWNGSTGEMVIEWRGLQKTTSNEVKFQMVFRPNSSDIEINYLATDGNGQSATVGVQTDYTVAAEQNFNINNPDLTVTGGTARSWKWTLNTGAPTANAGTDQNVMGNTLVNLSGTASDPDGGILYYAWTQTAGTLVTLNNANTLTPSFYAPNVTETLTFKLTVTDDAGLSTSDYVNVNVTAGAPAGSLQFSAVTYSANESDGNATITVTRSGGSAGIIGLSYATADGSAGSPDDYTYSSGTLSWADGDIASKTFSVPVNYDTLTESNETVSLSLFNATGGATLGTKNATLTIIDTPPQPGTLSFSNTAYSVNENGTTATITVTRSGGSSGAVSVDYASADGTAVAGSDYTTASGSLNWSDGDSADKTFTVAVADDSIVEGDETVALSLSNATGSATIGTASATLSIVDNDIPVYGTLSLSAATYSVNENGVSISVLVTRSGGSDGAVSVDYASANGTATAGSDYTAVSGTLNWTSGDSASKTITITIADDQIYEGDENFTIHLSNAIGGATTGTNTSTITISDNDVAVPGTLSISQSALSVTEDGVAATISVTRSGGSDGSVSVVYATVDDTAIGGEDYTASSGTLSWSHGDSSTKTINISILNDTNVENSESFAVGLSGASGASIGTADIVVTIVDDDVAPVDTTPTNPTPAPTDPVTANQPPGAPVLLSPANGATGIDTSLVTFQWNEVIDPDGDSVSYMLEYCDNADFVNCNTSQSAKLQISSPTMIAGLGGGAGMGIALFGFMGNTSRRRRIVNAATLIIASVVLTACGANIPLPGANGTLEQIALNLQSNTTYYWKVTATDEHGLSSVSEVWTFTTK